LDDRSTGHRGAGGPQGQTVFSRGGRLRGWLPQARGNRQRGRADRPPGDPQTAATRIRAGPPTTWLVSWRKP